MQISIELETETNTKEINNLFQSVIDQIFESQAKCCISCDKKARYGHRCFRKKNGELVNVLRLVYHKIYDLNKNQTINKSQADTLELMLMKDQFVFPQERLRDWMRYRIYENRDPYLLRSVKSI